jgi:hypothetical protein
MGFLAWVAAAVWSFNLTDTEVMRVILDALLWSQRELLALLRDFLLQVLPSAFQWTIFDFLRDYFQRTFSTHQVWLVGTFLLLTYLFASRLIAFLLRVVSSLLANAWLRHNARSSDSDAPAPAAVSKPQGWRTRLRFWRRHDAATPMTFAETVREMNAYLAASSGLRTLRWILPVVLLFLLASFLSSHQAGSSAVTSGFDWSNPFAAHPLVFWLGLYVFSAELLGQLLKLSQPRPLLRRPRPAEAPQAALLHDLLPLYLRGIGDHAAHILGWRRGSEQPTGSESPMRSPRPQSLLNGDQNKLFALKNIARILSDDAKLAGGELTRHLREMELFIEAPAYMILHESLHPLHLKIIFALCEDQQSRGRTTLIICPQHIVEDVESALKNCATSSLASLVQRGVVLGSPASLPLSTDLSYSYVVVADTDVERELLSSGPAAQFVLQNLGMIVALEAQDLQISLLRLRLPRLWLRVPREEEVKILVQVGSVANIAGLAEALLRKPERVQEIVWSTQFKDTTSAHTILWRGHQDSAKSVLEKYLAPRPTTSDLSTGLSLVTYAMTGSEQAFRSSSVFLNQTEVQRAAGQLASSRIAETGEGMAGALQLSSGGSEAARKAARVIIAEERVNVLVALAKFYDWHRHGEILLNLVVHDYPLRDFHVSQFKGGNNTAAGDAAQMAPSPEGGVRELLSTLHDALRESRGSAADTGLRRSQIVDKFLDRLPSKLRGELALVPGLNGFKGLFQRLGFSVPDIKAYREEGETRYEIDEGARDDFPELHFTIPVRVGGTDRVRLPSGDVGLTILPSQTILIEGRQHLVNEIGRTHILCTRQDRNLQAATLPVLEYRWDRLPAKLTADSHKSPPLDPTQTWLVDNTTPGGLYWVAHFYGSMVRRTVGRISFTEEIEPLRRGHGQNPITANAFDGAEQLERRRDYQSILQIQFNHLPNVKQSELPEFAFTTCVVMQDVIRARFPRWPHRINVLSPQAAPVFERCRGSLQQLGVPTRDEKARLDQLLASIYPRLVGEKPSPPSVAPDAENTPDDVGRLDVFLIEDSDFDLGIARQIRSDPRALIRQVWRYLDWLRQQRPAFKSRYHRFGAGSDSPLLVYDRVWDLIDMLPRDG